MKKYIVYKHTSPSNKIYIGITCQNIDRRWRNGNGYKSQKYFYRAIEKYGWDNFKHEILYENLEKEQAKILEMSLIYYYDSTNPSFGYNLTKGGEGHNGYSPSKETRKKLSEVHKGKEPWNKGKTNIFSDETRRKISENNKNRHLSDESKKKISEAHKGKNVGKNNGKAKAVICITTMTIFDCISQGALFYNLKNTNISKCCRGKTKFCGKLSDGTKLVWRYLTIIEL